MNYEYPVAILCAAALHGTALPAQEAPFLATDGLAVVEIESATDLQDWVAHTSIDEFTGNGYLRYEGDNSYGNPDNSVLSFRVQVDEAGTYRFQWRSRIAEGTSGTDHNDSWLRITGGTDFYADRGGDVVWPHGSGKSPNPQGAGKDGWLKVYHNRRDAWTWDSWTSDHDARPIFVDVDGPTELLIEVAGRSYGHAIDRVVLYHADVDESTAQDLLVPESPRSDTGGGGDNPDGGGDGNNDNPGGGDGGDEDDNSDGGDGGGSDTPDDSGDGDTSDLSSAPSAKRVTTYPNPTADRLHLRLTDGIAAELLTRVDLVDALGRPYPARLERGGEGASLRVAHLPAGIYRLSFGDAETRYVATFLRAGE